MGKTGLVVEGGGMKCAYNAGILDRFLDENIHFDYCIGVSAGSANVASYLAGQRDRNKSETRKPSQANEERKGRYHCTTQMSQNGMTALPRSMFEIDERSDSPVDALNVKKRR